MISGHPSHSASSTATSPAASPGSSTATSHEKSASSCPQVDRSPYREAIRALTRCPETDIVPGLLELARLPPALEAEAAALAREVAAGLRLRNRAGGRAGLVQDLLQEFALSSQEGVALMCLAEALLRIPDVATRDALIRDKIGDGDWQSHLGQSPSLFVNAAAWGLLLTGKLVATHSDTGLGLTLKRALSRGGEPLIRKGVDMAMRMMGEQFVTGESIAEALAHAAPREARGFRYSYDMLGEAALTAADAARYFAAYEQAIHAIGHASAGRGIIEGPGISIKLSALHPRYARSQRSRVQGELYPRLAGLARLARGYDMGLNIDAEESERLDISLDLLERLCVEPALHAWNGVGFVIQAYQKRCPAVVDFLIDLARRSGRRLMVRLVKGAYWDSEIKRAQVEGLADYPVYTRKVHTDVAYLACARKLLAAPDAVFPQFATHNAHTLAAIHALAGPNWTPDQYEFQCLHGMGEPLYEQICGPEVLAARRRPCRIYAPVGTHETLLAYLVRRLLENGANSSFVNRIADENISLEALIEDPVRSVEMQAGQDGRIGAPHPAIGLPADLFRESGACRENSAGADLVDESTLAALDLAFERSADTRYRAAPCLARTASRGPWRTVRNPADANDVLGEVQDASTEDVETAVAAATDAAAAWAATPPEERARRLDQAAARLAAQMLALVPLLTREAGKTRANAVAEVREAVDFLRYYAAEIRRDFNHATHVPLGPVVCISPWNFPLAIFVGQIAAALAAGNVVLAKPAEQTPLIAAEAVAALHAAGIPAGALQLLPGPGETIGASLVADARVNGVIFTGSTEVARILQQTLAQRVTARSTLVTLIAETGGQNAMIVDSSALTEQAVTDILASAFDSAGQRCSALRLLCVQQDAAERVLEMLRGAAQELIVGDPRELATDIGPVIDAAAREAIERHAARLERLGRPVSRLGRHGTAATSGFFVNPTLVELDSVGDLQQEVFGPVLHVLRYPRAQLGALLEAVNSMGYGLTQGVHTRIDETVAAVVAASTAGNVYVNRNIVGAVVGTQPFGGEGLSGTGPKAGGPLYLLRLLAERPFQAARLAVAHNGRAASAPMRGLDGPDDDAAAADARAGLRAWAADRGMSVFIAQCDQLMAESPVTGWRALPGPTGEANLYAVRPRAAVLCLGGNSDVEYLIELAAVLAVGSHALWPAAAQALRERLPAAVRERIRLVKDWLLPVVRFDAVLQHGTPPESLATAALLAGRPGPIVAFTALAPGEPRVPLERLVIERSLCINTAAAGGNASLMTIG